MDNKSINKNIRRISNGTALPLLIYFVIYGLFEAGVQAVIPALMQNGVTPDSGLIMLIAYIVLYVIIIPISLLMFYKLYGKRNGLTLRSCIKKPEKSAGWIVKWLFIALGISYASNMFSNIIFTIIEQISGCSFTAKSFETGGSVLGVISLAVALPIFAPVFEELLFRGTLCRNNEPLGQWFAVIVSSVMFGLWHLNYTQLLPAAVIGVFAGILMIKTRSIIPSMLLHFVMNFIGLIQILCLNDTDITSFEAASDPEYFLSSLGSHALSYLIIMFIGLLIIALIITGITLLVIELSNHKEEFKLKKCGYQIKPLKKLAVYFSAPLTIIVFVFMIAVTVLNAMGFWVL